MKKSNSLNYEGDGKSMTVFALALVQNFSRGGNDVFQGFTVHGNVDIVAGLVFISPLVNMGSACLGFGYAQIVKNQFKCFVRRDNSVVAGEYNHRHKTNNANQSKD